MFEWNVRKPRGLKLTNLQSGKSVGYYRVSCPHNASTARAGGACAGCFARLYYALVLIKDNIDSAPQVVESIFTSMRQENAAMRLKGTYLPQGLQDDGVQVLQKPMKKAKKKQS